MNGKLVFTSGGTRGTEVDLGSSPTRIGRDPTADVVVDPADQRFVSRSHAVIAFEDRAFVVVDQGSTNGTFVNGGRVERAVLRPGNVIRFGKGGPEARFEGEAVAAVTPPAAPGGRWGWKTGLLVGGIVGALVVGAIAVGALVREDPEDALRRLSTEYEGRVFFVQVGFQAPDGGYQPWSSGTAFSVGQGFLVTNKHVTSPEKSDPCLALELAGQPGYEKVLTVWQGGTDFRQESYDYGDPALGYSTSTQTLEMVVEAPDNPGPQRQATCDGRRVTYRAPRMDNNDLAVLRVTVQDFPGIPMAEEEPRADDPVMVLGFPVGLTPLETNEADPLRRIGSVLRTAQTIQIDAVVMHGNSGGPLINARGEVVGITTRGIENVLNEAIKIEHARRLLQRAQLIVADRD